MAVCNRKNNSYAHVKTALTTYIELFTTRARRPFDFVTISLKAMGMENSKFVSPVRTRRMERGISQGELAELAGLRQSMLCRIENGSRGLTLINLMKLTQLLGMDDLHDQIKPFVPAERRPR